MRNLPNDLASLSLVQSAALLRQRSVSAVELTRAALDRVERWQPAINAFIAVDPEGALAAAEAADEALARGEEVGPLHGVPLAHKDMFATAGAAYSGGSRMLGDIPQATTATVIARLRAAGATTIGALNMAEFAASPTGHNIHVGDCRNPWNPEFITGGSSSGSGAAVAARLVAGALGSDTGGSIRLPAAICGVTGLKPTYGRVSRYGAMARSWSLDTVGPLTRDAWDGALLASVVAGADPNDPTTLTAPPPGRLADISGDIKGLRIGVMPDRYLAELDRGIAAAHEAALAALVAAGAVRVAVAPEGFDEAYSLAEVISKSEAAALHRKWMAERPDDYSFVVFSRTQAGLHMPATRYLEAMSLRAPLLRRFVASVFEKADLLHLPMLPGPVPTRAQTDVGSTQAIPEMVVGLTRFTRPVNYLGLPSLSVPIGFDGNGLPIAMQLVGRPFAERRLFRAAANYQAVTDWHQRVPPEPAA